MFNLESLLEPTNLKTIYTGLNSHNVFDELYI